MIYYDIHTHHHSVQAEDVAITSVDLRNWDKLPAIFSAVENISGNNASEQKKTNIHPEYYSVGVHPWYPDKSLITKVCVYAELPSVVAIGETGLDKITAIGTYGFKLQQELFTEHIALSEKIKKPLIIHCVKAWDELLNIRKTIKPTMPWIIHGFRGNATLACQLLNTGLYLSFGAFYNRDSLKAAWEKRRLLAETDDTNTDICNVYAQIAKSLDITVKELSDEIEELFIHKLLLSFL